MGLPIITVDVIFIRIPVFQPRNKRDKDPAFCLLHGVFVIIPYHADSAGIRRPDAEAVLVQLGDIVTSHQEIGLLSIARIKKVDIILIHITKLIQAVHHPLAIIFSKPVLIRSI